MRYIDSTARIENSNLAENVRIYKHVDIRECTIEDEAIVGDFCRIEKTSMGRFTQVYPNGIMYCSTLDDYSYIQKNCSVWHTSIGKYCSISWNASIGGGEHDFNRVTSHAFLYSTAYGFVEKPMYNRFDNPCVIGNDCWIGAGVTILRGVTVGDGAIIGAGAVVTKSVEPYSIVAGVSAKKIGQRCTDELVEEMLEIQWWNMPAEIIKKNIDLFSEEITKDTIMKLKELPRKE